MELPAVNLKVIILVHWLLTTWGCLEFSNSYAWANFTILALGVWAVAQRDSLDAISMASWDLHSSAVPTRPSTHQRRPQTFMPARRARATPHRGTEANPAAPCPCSAARMTKYRGGLVSVAFLVPWTLF